MEANTKLKRNDDIMTKNKQEEKKIGTKQIIRLYNK